MKKRNPKTYRGARAIKTEHKKIATQQEQHSPVVIEQIATKPEALFHNENLLEKFRSQWQIGEWESLVTLDRDILAQHPDRAKLALITASAWLQLSNNTEARYFIKLAQDWGCDKKLISRVLVAGVHNSLGRAASVAKQESRALKHFESAIDVGISRSKIQQVTQARIALQLKQLTPSSAKSIIEKKNLSHLESILEPSGWIIKLVDDCLAAEDILEAIDYALINMEFNATEAFFFFILISDSFQSKKDKLTALSFLNSARQYACKVNDNLRAFLIKKFIELGFPDEGTDIIVESALIQVSEKNMSDEDTNALAVAYEKTRVSQKAKSEHGHEVILSYLSQNLPRLVATMEYRKPIFIEIGTTRENIPGQGSTLKIAEFCMLNGLYFITVDMDAHNTRVAAKMFHDMDLPFEAINMKGEDYLQSYNGEFDFIFLDAYDFDHGKHSELRQSRYKKFLGAPIDDTECHKMHLTCAKLIKEKLSQNGLLCLDDTWLKDGKWTAKGTLAMPYLIENGFYVLEARNRAALLSRCK